MKAVTTTLPDRIRIFQVCATIAAIFTICVLAAVYEKHVAESLLGIASLALLTTFIMVNKKLGVRMLQLITACVLLLGAGNVALVLFG
jgi:hypothetical protein